MKKLRKRKIRVYYKKATDEEEEESSEELPTPPPKATKGDIESIKRLYYNELPSGEINEDDRNMGEMLAESLGVEKEEYDDSYAALYDAADRLNINRSNLKNIRPHERYGPRAKNKLISTKSEVLANYDHPIIPTEDNFLNPEIQDKVKELKVVLEKNTDNNGNLLMYKFKIGGWYRFMHEFENSTSGPMTIYQDYISILYEMDIANNQYFQFINPYIDENGRRAPFYNSKKIVNLKEINIDEVIENTILKAIEHLDKTSEKKLKKRKELRKRLGR